MLKRLLAVSAAALMTVGSYAIATELRGDHPSTYTVVKGDTLWDIAGRFLKKPWQWPEIWQANPQIKNPHLIYPGDVISLAYLDGKPTLSHGEGGPRIRVGEPVGAVPLADVQAFLKQLEVRGEDIRSLPHVIGLEDDRLVASAGQTAYVRGLAAQPGETVRFVRPTARYVKVNPKPGSQRDGVTSLDFRGRPTHYDGETFWSEAWQHEKDGSGSFLGYEVMTHALGEVTQVRGDLTVVVLRDEQRDVRVGDRVVAYEERPYDASFFPHPPASVPAGARILAVADGLYGAGTRSVVALAAGRNQGVDNGTTFSVWTPGMVVPDRVKHGNLLAAKNDKVTLPDEFVGNVMVFRTFDNVSYGLLMDGIKPVRVNDLLKHPDATQ